MIMGEPAGASDLTVLANDTLRAKSCRLWGNNGLLGPSAGWAAETPSKKALQSCAEAIAAPNSGQAMPFDKMFDAS